MYIGPQDPNVRIAPFQEEQRRDAGELICKQIIKRNLSALRRELRLKKSLSLQTEVFQAPGSTEEKNHVTKCVCQNS